MLRAPRRSCGLIQRMNAKSKANDARSAAKPRKQNRRLPALIISGVRKSPRKVPSGRTATLTFELPEGEEALTNAVQGMKWQQMVLDVIHILTHWGDTGRPEHRGAYRDTVRVIRDEMKDAGLTVVSADNLMRFRMEQQKRHAKELDIAIKKSLQEDEEL